ncbi:YcxB family protein [Psychrosphaera aestuarii]|uniref:YcxB family protein n=1 Tax=Psychrosphaera aestuarii TaxID=1266052 RepID=UPI001B327ECC|nr:YcxB family protein [Psychrosphaera aestuarii]
MSFTFETTFKLDKAFYHECFEQSANKPTGLKAYKKALAILILGCIALLLGQLWHVAIFIIVLSVIEAMSVYWQQTWWVWRQMLSKESNSDVTLKIDEAGVSTQTLYHEVTIEWDDIKSITRTEKGVILTYTKGRYYLSFAHLSEAAKAFIEAKVSS